MRAIIALPLVLLPLLADAQFGRAGRTSLSFGGRMGNPMGEFDAVHGQNLWGYGGNVLLPMRGVPFAAGFQFDHNHLGGRQREVPVEHEFLAATTGTLKVNSDMRGYHAIMRLAPINARVSPYLDGLAGWRTFSTSTRLLVSGVDGPLTSERSGREAAFGYGWAAGLMVRIAGPFNLEGRVERLYGGRAAYVDPASIEIDGNGAVLYDTKRSDTDVLMFHAGISFRF